MVFSYDGIPYLMHDKNLLRTTNVKSVFPGRELEVPWNFNISDVLKLDAGSWFNGKGL